MGINIDAAAVTEPARLAEPRRATRFTADLHDGADARRGRGVRTDSAGTAVSSVRTSSRRSATSPLDTSSRLHHLRRAPDRSRPALRRSRRRGIASILRVDRSSLIRYIAARPSPRHVGAMSPATMHRSRRSLRSPPMELTGAHVVVTGAARGIGAALARRFHAAGPASSSPTSSSRAPSPTSARRAPSAIVADVSTEAGQRRADRCRRGGVRPGRPVLRQRRRRPAAPT